MSRSRDRRLPVYAPALHHAPIYTPHPAARPVLRYNHDVDVVRFQGRYLAGWNANEQQAEDVPGQFNFLSVSDDFQSWSPPVRLFTADADCENPVESDNQWQPSFINLDDRALLCNWCDYNARRTFISSSADGLHWRNQDVPPAPPALTGQVVGFPTNHGLRSRQGTLLFACSLPATEDKCIVGHTRYAGVLLSFDSGQTWAWSAHIEAISWSEIGEDPALHGGETVYLWEPALYEEPSGRIGLLVRNSTSQDAPERHDEPHHMILHAYSDDQGRTWSKARPIEVDSIISRNYAVAGAGTPDGLLMVMNDWWVNIPQRISHDRYHLALYCAPVCDPDLLLPGPVVQPPGGTAFYPNGFVEDGRLYLGYTYPPCAWSTIVEELPDFTRPFLLPRGGRSGLRLEGDLAVLGQRQSSLGLVLTAEQTRQAELRLAFDANVQGYNGAALPLLTLGGKTRQGAVLRVVYDAEAGADVLQVGGVEVGRCTLRRWQRLGVGLTREGFTVQVDQQEPRRFDGALLRKVCFGGLYEKPEWPMGMLRSQDVRLRTDTIEVGG